MFFANLIGLLADPDDSSGLILGSNYASYEPHTLMILISYMLMAVAIGLYFQFGLSFLIKSKNADSVAQRQYYLGFGAVVLTITFSQFLMIANDISKDLFERELFRSAADYNPPFASFFPEDYYIFIFMMVLVALVFLTYPIEKYLFKEERKPMTTYIAVCIPIPLVIRVIEINHERLNLDISEPGTLAQVGLSVVWIVVIGAMILAFIYLLNLFLQLGRKAPPKSKLRRKSKAVIAGLIIWLPTILWLRSFFLRELARVDSPYDPNSGIVASNQFVEILQNTGVYYIFPFLVPALLITALGLLVYGFTRDY